MKTREEFKIRLHVGKQLFNHLIVIALLMFLLAFQASAASSARPDRLSKADLITVETAPSVPVREAAFFAFDDYSIPWKDNLKLTLVEAEKYPGNPVISCGPEGTHDSRHVVIYGSVIKVGDKFRMWYLATWKTSEAVMSDRDRWRPMCYAESDDGIHWTKPNLGLVEFNGNKNNNICLIEPESSLMSRVNDFLSVMYDPDDPDPARRYKIAYIAHIPRDKFKGGVRNVDLRDKLICSMICATSADGLTWHIVGDRPSVNEKFEVSGLYKFGDFYYASGQQISPWSWLPDGARAGRVMTIYRSPDLLNWSKAKVFGFARPGQQTRPPITGQQTHMGAGMWDRGNVIVGLYGMWENGPGPSEKPGGSTYLGNLGLIVSNNGMHFREPVPDFKVIPRDSETEWDSIMILQGHAFANVGDRTYIWYGHSDWDCTMKGLSSEIGLAFLRRDGFGYLSRKETSKDAAIAGHFVTCQAKSKTGKASLKINADGLSPQAPLKIELLDSLDRPIPAYSGTNAAQLTSSGISQEVIWPGTKSGVISLKEPFAVNVEFPLTGDVRVFAVYINGQ